MTCSHCGERRGTLKKKLLLIVSIIIVNLLLCNSSVFSTQILWGHVSSVNYYFDDPTLISATVQEFYRMYASSGIDQNYTVYLNGGPLIDHELEYWGTTWGDYEYGDHFNSWPPENFPVPGNSWLGNYTFGADTSGDGNHDVTFNWSINAGQIKQIALPENVQIIGDKLSWLKVEYANSYRVRAYTLDSNGYVDFSNLFYNGIVADPTPDTILFDLTGLAGIMDQKGLEIEDIAISIHSREYLEPTADWANSSRYYFRPDDHVAPVPEPSTLCLLGAGLVGLVGLGRKKLKQ
jgi:hypothetical protein